MSGHVARKRETEATRHRTGEHVAKKTKTLTVDANVSKKREYRHSTPSYYTRKIKYVPQTTTHAKTDKIVT